MISFELLVVGGFGLFLLGLIYIRALISDMEKDTHNLMLLGVNLTLLLRECRHELGLGDMLQHSEDFKKEDESSEVKATQVFLNNKNKNLH